MEKNELEEQVNDIQHNVAVYAREWIYSRNPLTAEQLERVKGARNRVNYLKLGGNTHANQ